MGANSASSGSQRAATAPHCSAPMSIASVTTVVVNSSVRMTPNRRESPDATAVHARRPRESPGAVRRRVHCTALPMLNGRISA